MGSIFSANDPNKPLLSLTIPSGPIKPIIKQPGELSLNHPARWRKLFKRNSHAITKFQIQLLDRGPHQGSELPPPRSQKVAQMLKHKRTISSLHYICTASSSYEMSFLISKLKDLHHLVSLDLNLSAIKSCTPQHLKDLSTTLGNFKELTSLTITFPDSIEMIPKHLISLGFVFHRLRSLTHLSFKFSPQQRPSFPCLKPLAKLLKKLSKLQSLALSQFASITPLALTFLPPVLKKLTSLQSLSIDLTEMGSFQSKHLKQVFLALKDLPNPLKNIAFNFKDCAVDFPSTWPLSQGLSILNLSELQSFKLNCYSNLTYQTLEHLTAALQVAPLKLLDLDLSKNRSSPHSLFFSLDLQAFQSLSHLYLNPGDTENGIQSVGAALRSLVNLKSLNVNFSKQPKKTVDDNELICFSANLRDLQNLKHLSLNLNGLSRITDKGLIPLSDSLQGLTGISSLNFELADLTIDARKGVLRLFSLLTKLRNLRDLSLDLSGKSILRVGDLHNLAEAIRNLSLLSEVNLNFTNCAPLSKERESFGPLFRSLGKLKFLKKMILYLPSKIEDQTTAVSHYFKHVEDQTIHWNCLYEDGFKRNYQRRFL